MANLKTINEGGFGGAKGLTPEQEFVATELGYGKSIKQVSEERGIPGRTIYNWLERNLEFAGHVRLVNQDFQTKMVTAHGVHAVSLQGAAFKAVEEWKRQFDAKDPATGFPMMDKSMNVKDILVVATALEKAHKIGRQAVGLPLADAPRTTNINMANAQAGVQANLTRENVAPATPEEMKERLDAARAALEELRLVEGETTQPMLPPGGSP